MNTLTRSFASLTVVLVAGLVGCASSGGGQGDGKLEEHAVVHTSTPADAAHLKDTAPVASSRARLYVNGMGCPQCVSNIDLQLAKLRGVKSTKVNLGDGTVDVEFYSKERPSPAQLNKAVSGDFTLVKIEELKSEGIQ